MQLEAADWSIQATPPVHLQGFTPRHRLIQLRAAGQKQQGTTYCCDVGPVIANELPSDRQQICVHVVVLLSVWICVQF